MDQDLIAYLDARFAKIDERFDQMQEAIRQTQIVLEETRSEVQLLAEGVIGVQEQLQALRVRLA
jgi:hypothetical protein